MTSTRPWSTSTTSSRQPGSRAWRRSRCSGRPCSWRPRACGTPVPGVPATDSAGRDRTGSDTRAGQEESLRRHAEAPRITAVAGNLCHAMTVRACRAAGFEPAIRHQVAEFATVLAFVAAGHGVAVVPQLGIPGSGHEGVVLSRLLMERRTMLALRGGAARHPAVAALTVALLEVVPTEPAESRAAG
ncbi:LysR substrate-binding domain-containing protein [Streptomyces sp. A1136]|uniref:LysR substrate-binding domain-containing protein n=1 Tax=Streptomyces sp. A1136 TaxID=2563102 RepID=UPI0023F156D9|nr:LysR substrate-binding domain-containing protein [Streptomyces sp. A1136]